MTLLAGLQSPASAGCKSLPESERAAPATGYLLANRRELLYGMKMLTTTSYFPSLEVQPAHPDGSNGSASMHVAKQEPRSFVRIVRFGATAFGWEICREVNSVQVDRSVRRFPTCIEALLDSARAAATLALGAIELPSVDGESINVCK
jgi:hypothetical protein